MLTKAGRRLCRFAGIVLVLLLQPAFGVGAFAQGLGPLFICIGDICCVDGICAGTGRYNLGCEFARAHPSDADEQAAKYVCTIENKYSGYSFVRQSNASGSGCGETILMARCH
jgi:hypothetical protein